MMSNFVVNILTPSSVVAKHVPADSVFIPTLKGEIEVLAGHTHIVEKLATGSVEVHGEDSERFFTVTNGIVKVLNDQITILSMTSEEDSQIDEERASNALIYAREKLKGTLTDEELVKYRRKVERAQLRLQLVKQVKK